MGSGLSLPYPDYAFATESTASQSQLQLFYTWDFTWRGHSSARFFSARFFIWNSPWSFHALHIIGKHSTTRVYERLIEVLYTRSKTADGGCGLWSVPCVEILTLGRTHEVDLQGWTAARTILIPTIAHPAPTAGAIASARTDAPHPARPSRRRPAGRCWKAR